MDLKNIEKICRFCLNERDYFNNLDDEIKEKFEELTNARLEIIEYLPNKICDDCKDNLDCYHSFREELLACQNRLQTWFLEKSIKSENLQTIPEQIHDSFDDFLTNSPENRENLKATKKPKKKDKKTLKEDLENPIICSECSKQFSSKKSFQLHFYNVHLNSSRNCMYCNKTFKNPKSLSNHKVRHLLENRKKCQHCDKLFFPADYARHLRTHFNLKLHMCTHCGVRYSQAYSLTRHIRKKHSENSKIVIKCDKCQKTFNKKSDLREHEILCKNRKFKEKTLYRCNVQNCEYKSETRKMVKKHLERVHDTKISNFETYCLECNQQFETVGDYSVHAKTHTCQYVCKICKVRFRTFAKLENHELNHENDLSERKFQCRVCQATFKSAGHLNQHKIFKHSSERNFSCSLCSLKFKYNGELRGHIRNIHQNLRPFKCLQCPLDFKKANSLRSHSQTVHDSNFIYNCQCQKTFEFVKDFKRHKTECDFKDQP